MYRITSDIDNKNKFILSYYFLKSLFLIKNIKEIIIKPSNSKGYHLIIWTTHKYSLKKIYLLRSKIGDDKNRIRLDKKRKIARNTLFNKKYYNKKL